MKHPTWSHVGVSLISSVGMLLVLQSCYLYIPDFDGTYIPHSATIHTDKKTAADILKRFRQAEDALKRQDLDSLMDFYADHYKHAGFSKDSLRDEWKALFEQYREFSATHVLTRIEVALDADRLPRTAQITCTGSLWAISRATNRRVNIDSWYNEIHYLAKFAGSWRIEGHAWEVANHEDARTTRPPHPLF